MFSLKFQKEDIRILNYGELNASQVILYETSVLDAFPAIIHHSEVVKHSWEKIERYFPAFQLFAFNATGELMGIVNSVPFSYSQALNELPEEGWDWLVEKAIEDFEIGASPNFVGGLQIIVTRNFRGTGLSYFLIEKLKELQKKKKLDKIVIPIRPNLKHKYPEVNMKDYLKMENEGKILDPWIRAHTNCGAEIIKVCSKSMYVFGDLEFWKSIAERPLVSGKNKIEGALNLVEIDLVADRGEYYEENIWIQYN